jgi:O-antigen/teichoic acid export membrane protein
LYAASGTNRVRDIQAAQLWSNIAYFMVVSLLLWARAGLAAIVLGTALRAFMMRQMARHAYYRAVPKDENHKPQPDLNMVKRLWPNSWKFGVQSLGGYLLVNANVLICGHVLGEATTASLGATNRVGVFVTGLEALWLSVKWPQLTMLRTQGRLPEMSVLFARRLALVMITFVVLAAAIVAFANPLLALKGTSTRLLSVPQMTLYFAYLGLGLFYLQWAMLAMTDNTVPFFKLGIATGIGIFALGSILVHVWGLWGLLLAPLIVESAGSAWYCTRAGLACQPLSWRQLIRAAASGRT